MLAQIADADLIIVLKDGAVVEQGRHTQLLRKRDGVYSMLWNVQQESEAQELLSNDGKEEERAGGQEQLDPTKAQEAEKSAADHERPAHVPST